MRYETDPSATCEALGAEYGCTHQNISKKARKEGWVRCNSEIAKVARSLDIAQPVAGSLYGKRSPETVARIISVYAMSGNKSMAARTVGITAETLANWCKEDPELLVAMDAQRHDFLASQYEKVANGPWQAAVKVLETARETRDQFAPQQGGNTTFVLQIVRE